MNTSNPDPFLKNIICLFVSDLWSNMCMSSFQVLHIQNPKPSILVSRSCKPK